MTRFNWGYAATVFVGTVAVVTPSIYLIQRMRASKKPSPKEITEREFLEIMKIISKNIFSKIFYFSQISARVIPRNRETNLDAIRANQPQVRIELGRSQDRVLEQFHLTESDLVYAQKIYYKKGNNELDIIVDSIEEMFENFSNGEFPVLPNQAFDNLPNQSIPDDEILAILADIYADKLVDASSGEDAILTDHGWSDSIRFYNTVAERLNNSPEFKLGLVKILIANQNEVRNIV